MTSQASMWKLGEVRSNAKGGKFLCLEPLFWQSEASLEIPWEPRAFSEGQRPSVSFATDVGPGWFFFFISGEALTGLEAERSVSRR